MSGTATSAAVVAGARVNAAGAIDGNKTSLDAGSIDVVTKAPTGPSGGFGGRHGGGHGGGHGPGGMGRPGGPGAPGAAAPGAAPTATS